MTPADALAVRSAPGLAPVSAFVPRPPRLSPPPPPSTQQPTPPTPSPNVRRCPPPSFLVGLVRASFKGCAPPQRCSPAPATRNSFGNGQRRLGGAHGQSYMPAHPGHGGVETALPPPPSGPSFFRRLEHVGEPFTPPHRHCGGASRPSPGGGVCHTAAMAAGDSAGAAGGTYGRRGAYCSGANTGRGGAGGRSGAGGITARPRVDAVAAAAAAAMAAAADAPAVPPKPPKPP